jgi:hypothetical protein
MRGNVLIDTRVPKSSQQSRVWHRCYSSLREIKVMLKQQFTCILLVLILGSLISVRVSSATDKSNAAKAEIENGGVTETLEDVGPVEIFAGVGSHLAAGQYARVVDSGTWRQLWFSHQGKIDNGQFAEVPVVDFANQMVIVIVEKKAGKATAIQFQSMKQLADGLELEYQLRKVAKTKRNAQRKSTGSPFAFFVLPRQEGSLLLRRGVLGEAGFQVVTRFPCLQLGSLPAPTVDTKRRRLNICFSYEPGSGNYNGVIGKADEVWNFVDVGTTAIEHTRNYDGSFSSVRLRVSPSDGEWGIAGRKGVFHGYIYHNCRCLDLTTTVMDLPEGRYRVIVLAHGDAPDQNARIELQVDGVSVGMKSTLNNGTWGFRKNPYREGVHYVSFVTSLQQGNDLRIISHRDGSDYSMFNAIQIVPLSAEENSEPSIGTRRKKIQQANP